MGLCEKSEIEDYWAKWWITATPGYAKVMPRDRFEVILSFFHRANNDDHVPRGQDGHDRLFKICPLIDLLVPKFRQLFYLGKELALYEMTIERENLICFAHRHNNQIDNTHKKKSLVAKAREHRGTFRLSSRDTP